MGHAQLVFLHSRIETWLHLLYPNKRGAHETTRSSAYHIVREPVADCSSHQNKKDEVMSQNNLRFVLMPFLM
jgi:hypothetical protein